MGAAPWRIISIATSFLLAGYITLEQVSPGASIEIDVGTYWDQAEQTAAGGGTATRFRYSKERTIGVVS